MAVIFTIIGMLLSQMATVFLLCRKLGFNARDTVCAVYCATHKSLTLGKAAEEVQLGLLPASHAKSFYAACRLPSSPPQAFLC